MPQHYSTSFVLVILSSFLAVLGGCASVAEEIVPMATPVARIEVPTGVAAAREAVLDFLREGANECVPPAGVRWQASPGASPAGFGVYRFAAEDCVITVSYVLAPAEEAYHVALGDTTTGFCWQAIVDAAGQVVRTGRAAETEPGIGNAAAAYCEAQGYGYEIRTQADGAQCGVCVFPDGTTCNGWAYFRGDCGPGAVSGGGG